MSKTTPPTIRAATTGISRPTAESLPLARREVGKRNLEVAGAEVGPQRVRDVQLRVRRLPEQEIADSHLARRADDEVGVGQSACVQGTAHHRLVKAGEILTPCGEVANAVDNFRTAPVIHRDIENRVLVVSGELLCIRDARA